HRLYPVWLLGQSEKRAFGRRPSAAGSQTHGNCLSGEEFTGTGAEQDGFAGYAESGSPAASHRNRRMFFQPAGADLRPRLPWTLLPPNQKRQPDPAGGDWTLYHGELYPDPAQR